MKHLLQKHSKYLWLSLLLLLVGATAIAIPRINGINEDSPVAKIGDNGYATLQAAIEAAESGATIELLQDVDLSSAVTGTSRLPISKSLTFNGNNRVITMGGRGFGVGMNATSKIDVVFNDLTIENSANGARCIDTRGNVNSLTLNNVILKTDGATSGYTQPLTIGGNQAVAATVNITNSTIQTNNDGTAYYAIITFNPVNMTISNSTIKGWACIYAKGPDSSAGSAGSVFTLDGCTVVSTNKYSGESNSFGTFMMEDNNVTINVTNSNITINNSGDQDQAIASYPENTSYTGAVSLGEGNNVQFNSTGTGTCSFVTNGTSATFEVSGGTFNTPVPEEYCAEGFTLVDNGDGTYSVAEPSYVAQIEGGAKYATLQAAVDAAHEMTGNVTITLIDNNEGYSIVHQKEGLNLTIDGDDKTVAGQIIIDGDGRASGTETLTIQNIKFEGNKSNFYSGTDAFILVPSTKTSGTPYYTNKYNYAHNITISNCSFTSTSSSLDVVGIKPTSGAGCYNLVVDNTEGTNLHSLAQLTGTTGASFDNCSAGSKNFINISGGTGDYSVTDCSFTSLNVSDSYAIRLKDASTAHLTLDGNNDFKASSAIVLTATGDDQGNEAMIEVKSGIYTGSIEKNNEAVLAISGGYFSEEFPQEYLAADLVAQGKVCTPAPDMEGYFTVGDPHYVAQIGETGYVSLQAAVDAAYEMSGDVTITLIDDIEGYSIVKQKAGLNLTIDGAGKTVAGQIIIDGDGGSTRTETLDIKNIKFEGNTSNFCSGTDAFILVPSTNTAGTPYYNKPTNNYAHNVTISDCSFTSTSTGLNVVAIKTSSGGGNCYNLVVKDVTGTNLHSLAQLTGSEGANSITNCTVTSSESFVNVSGGTGTFTVSGNTFTSAEGADGYGIRENSGSSAVITLTDNTFTAASAVKLGKSGSATNGTINVVSGTYVGDIVKDIAASATGKIVISGGQFSADLTDTTYEPFIAEGKIGVKNNAVEGAPYSVEDGTYVAQVTLGESTHKYGSLEAAFAAAADGSTVKLLDDCAGNGIVVPQGKYTTGLTVDFDNYTYTVDGETVGSTGTETNGFQLLKDNTITFMNGTITSTKAKILVQNYSNLTLEGMTLTLDNENYTSAYTLSNNNGNVVIDGTTINANPAGGFAFDVCRYSSYTSVNVTVTGESVINGNIEFDAGSGDPKDGVSLTVEGGTITGNLSLTSGGSTALTDHSDKASVTKNDAIELAAPVGFKWVSNGDGTSTLKPCEYICAIGSVKYETLAEAVAAAGTSETTITLLEEAAVDGVISGTGVVVPSGSNITFDLNGLTYNVTGSTVGSTGTETQGFQLLKESNITFKNGTLKATSPTAQMVIQNYSNLTLEDVTIDGTGLSGWAYALSNNCGTINLTGSTSIIAKEGGRAFDTCKFSNYDIPTVNINTTGTITGPIEATGGKLNIENGKFDVTWVTDSHYAEGDIQITGGVFTKAPDEEYCAEGYVPTFNTDPETKADYPYAVKSKDDDVYVLIDGEDYPFMDLPSDIKVSSVTYKRTFSSTQVNKHQAWFVPMDYTITADDAENFTFYKIQMIAGAAEAGEADHDKIYLYIEPMSEGEVLKGNRPYTVKPKNAVSNYEFTADGTKLYAPNTGSRLNVTTSFHSYDFYGKYARESYSGSVGDMFFLSGGSLHPNNATTTLLPYRWIIKVTANTINDDYSKIEFSIVEDGDATGIDRTHVINSDEVEGIYTTNGMKVDEPVRGINIIRYKNGKTEKIIVK
ncbi:MAG: hypothetical protein IKZ61_09850 [Prevotella sp.]|nr:hypothetical protein [Prevotella sp.]